MEKAQDTKYEKWAEEVSNGDSKQMNWSTWNKLAKPRPTHSTPMMAPDGSYKDTDTEKVQLLAETYKKTCNERADKGAVIFNEERKIFIEEQIEQNKAEIYGPFKHPLEYLTNPDLRDKTDEWNSEEYNSLITLEELQSAIKRLHRNRSPGPDKMKNEFLMMYKEDTLRMIVHVHNVTKAVGFKPDELKAFLIAFALKPGKDPSDPNSYRPKGGS